MTTSDIPIPLKISLIVAHGKKRQIGQDNELLWKVRSDLLRFKRLTMGHAVVMGRKTFESLKGRKLPGRQMVVLSKQHLDLGSGIICLSSKEAVTQWAISQNLSHLFVIGGEEIYRVWMEEATSLYVTIVDYDGPADRFFPAYNREEWQVVEEEHCLSSSEDEFDSTYYHFVRSSK